MLVNLYNSRVTQTQQVHVRRPLFVRIYFCGTKSARTTLCLDTIFETLSEQVHDKIHFSYVRIAVIRSNFKYIFIDMSYIINCPTINRVTNERLLLEYERFKCKLS